MEGLKHGLPMNLSCLIWLFFPPTLFLSLVVGFRLNNLWNFKVRYGTRASDIMAFEIVAGLCVLYLGISGIIGNFELFNIKPFEVYDYDVNLYKHSHFIENHLLIPMFFYQFWNLIISLFNKDLGSFEMIIHHLFAALSAYIALYPYNQQYSLYFYGITELTNIPLTIVDIFKYFPHFKKEYDWINQIARYTFALSFFTLRLLIWPFYLVSIDTRIIDRINKGKCHSIPVEVFILLTSGVLTTLQYYWGYKIISFLFKKKNYTE